MNNAQQMPAGTNERNAITEEARSMSVRYANRKVFVTQTSHNSFNFHFGTYNHECGMLTAIFLNGKSVNC